MKKPWQAHISCYTTYAVGCGGGCADALLLLSGALLLLLGALARGLLRRPAD